MKYIRLVIIAVLAILMVTQLLGSASAQEEKMVVTDFNFESGSVKFQTIAKRMGAQGMAWEG